VACGVRFGRGSGFGCRFPGEWGVVLGRVQAVVVLWLAALITVVWWLAASIAVVRRSAASTPSVGGRFDLGTPLLTLYRAKRQCPKALPDPPF
jgi:hypothetical protein